MQLRMCGRGILLDRNDRILLTLEQITPGVDEFWVLPGGGLDPDDESMVECVQREFLEETGIIVDVGSIKYVQEFISRSTGERQFSLMFEVKFAGGALHTNDRGVPLQGDNPRRHTQWFGQDELRDMRIYPEELRSAFWRDRTLGVTTTRLLGGDTD